MGRTIRLTGSDAQHYVAMRNANSVFSEKQAVQKMLDGEPGTEFYRLLEGYLRKAGWLTSLPVAGEVWVRKRDREEVKISKYESGIVSFANTELVVWDRELAQFLRNYRKKGADDGKRKSKASEAPKARSRSR